jgi:catechol 2,3-dioxygenase-like lactoylglutathione lyase family enzyme
VVGQRVVRSSSWNLTVASEQVVPVLPTRNLKETLGFYNALGFQTTHEQHAPYVYGAIKLGGIELHFVALKSLEVGQESGHICLVMVRDVNAIHQAFTRGIKARFGKQLRSGIPRMGGVNALSKDRRFNLIDPNGNRLIVIQTLEKAAKKPKSARTTPLAKAISAARLDAYSRDAPAIAAEWFDKALEQIKDKPSSVLFRAFVLRADIAAMLDDQPTLEQFVSKAKAIALSDAETLEVAEELERLAELEV